MSYAPAIFGFFAGTIRFIILLGVLVFVHEIGHYIAAKLTNVYVVRLSLGFGIRLFGFKRGETDYCVSAIPLGGYVKMVGQEDMPRTKEEAEAAEPEFSDVPPERRFDTQPAWKKLTISFAGPLMNLLFGFPILWLVFMVGIQVPLFIQHTRIGGVIKGSPADKAGIKPGQRVLSIDGEPIKKWDELQIKIWTSEGTPLTFELEDPSGERIYATATPARQEDSPRTTLGIEPLTSVAISHVVAGMPAERSGLKTGDIILTYNDKTPDNETMSKFVETVNASAGQPLVLTILRDGRPVNVTVVPETVRAIQGLEFDGSTIAHVDADNQHTRIGGVIEGSPADKAGIKPGQRVLSVNGEPVKKWDELQIKIRTSEGKPLALELEDLSGEKIYTTVTPARQDDSSGTTLGIEPLASVAISHVVAGMPAERSGLKTGDIILTYNHKTADNETMSKLVETVNASAGQPLVLTILRDDRPVNVTVVPETVRVIKGLEFDGNIIAHIDADNAGPAVSMLQRGDVVTAVDGDPLGGENIEDSLTTKIHGYETDSAELTVERRRGLFSKPERFTVSVLLAQKGVMGVVFGGTALSMLQPGDVVTAIDGDPLGGENIEDWLTTKIYGYETDSAELTVERDPGLFNKPERFTVSVPLVQKGMMGVVFSPMITEKFGPAQAFLEAIDAFQYSFTLTLRMFYYLFARKVSTREMAGPLGIAFLTEESLQLGIGYYLNLVALITINLALVNLLPIPVLDGGMILITLIERVRRKPLDEKYLVFMQKVGLALILFLILVATYNDIARAGPRIRGIIDLLLSLGDGQR